MDFDGYISVPVRKVIDLLTLQSARLADKLNAPKPARNWWSRVFGDDEGDYWSWMFTDARRRDADRRIAALELSADDYMWICPDDLAELQQGEQ